MIYRTNTNARASATGIIDTAMASFVTVNVSNSFQLHHHITQTIPIDNVCTIDIISTVTKYMPPCCRSSYVWYMKQNRHSNYSNKQA